MKATGVVRRIDELGRIVVPKEVRRTMRIKEGESLEIFIEDTDKIVLKKDCVSGNDINHSIDLKLDSSDAYIPDIYKTVIKFEAEQKRLKSELEAKKEQVKQKTKEVKKKKQEYKKSKKASSASKSSKGKKKNNKK